MPTRRKTTIPKIYGQRLKARKDQGFTWLKMDLGIDLMDGIPGCVTRPEGVSTGGGGRVQHMFTGIELTPKGVAKMGEYVAAVREQVGWEVPLSADHFGHIGVNSCIKLGKELEKYNLAWLEDMIPWQYTDLLKKITDAVDIPRPDGRRHLPERAVSWSCAGITRSTSSIPTWPPRAAFWRRRRSATARRSTA